MRKLLSANFVRLKKSKVFWAATLFLVVFGIVLVLNQYKEHVLYGYEVKLNTVFFGYTILIGIICAAFCSLFLGTEYSDGTIRNKLVVGHTRTAIYVSNFITVTVAALLMCAAFVIVVSVVGTPLIGLVKASPRLLAGLLFGSTLMICAVCAILTLISMLNQNKAVSAVICILGMVALLFAAVVIKTKLEAPEFYDGFVFSDSLGSAENEQIANPEYLTGTARLVYECIYDILPTGQALQYSGMTANHLWQMMLYSLLITIGTTLTGIVCFGRKDVK